MSIRQGNKVISGHINYHPDLFDHKWADHLLNDVSWLRADTFSWQDGGVYEAAYNHLVDDVLNGEVVTYYAWYNPDEGTYYTLSATPSYLDDVYVYNNGTYIVDSNVSIRNIYSDEIIVKISGGLPVSLARDSTRDGQGTAPLTPQTETIAGITITYYLAADGHKIVLADQESNVAAIYSATGVAWYYIIDTVNERFKLPRSKHNKYANSLGVIGNGKTLGLTDGTKHFGTFGFGSNSIAMPGYSENASGKSLGSTASTMSYQSSQPIIGVETDPTKSGMIAQQEQDTNQYKHLYFYVGNFTQTALENTAGLNASLFNGKADIDLTNAVSNASTTAKETIVGWGIPDFSRATTLPVSQTPALATQNMYVWGALPGNGYFNVNTSNTYSDTDFNRRFGNLSTWSVGNCIVPKGCYYYANTTTGSLYWCPLKGE